LTLFNDIQFYAGTFYALRAARQVEQGRCREVQSRRLKALAKHAYDSVELYRRKYDQAGVRPEDIQTVDDLHKLPIITRRDLVDGFPEAILARGFTSADCRLVATSGSTGTPLRMFKDRDLLRRGALGMLMTHKLIKRRLGINVRRGMLAILVKTPESIEAAAADEVFKLPRLLTKAYHTVSATENTSVHLRALAEHKPDILLTYPSVLRNLAITARNEGISVHQPNWERLQRRDRQHLCEHRRRLNGHGVRAAPGSACLLRGRHPRTAKGRKACTTGRARKRGADQPGQQIDSHNQVLGDGRRGSL
jgi:phenylacetate-coenzyme A ligase PaaK-like adenylate-forming protein